MIFERLMRDTVTHFSKLRDSDLKFSDIVSNTMAIRNFN